jgi:hypothetical protein
MVLGTVLARSRASAADLKFLHRRGNFVQELQIESGTGNDMIAGAPLFPKFVSEIAQMIHELRKRGTSVGAAA